MYKDFSREEAPFCKNLDAGAWTSVLLTRHLVPAVFGAARPRMCGSSSQGVCYVMSPLELIDRVTLALVHHRSSLHATVEVAGLDLCMFPYHVGELHLDLAPRGSS